MLTLPMVYTLLGLLLGYRALDIIQLTPDNEIVQIIAEDQEKQSQVQAAETLIKAINTEDSETKSPEPRIQNEDAAVDPDPGPDTSS